VIPPKPLCADNAAMVVAAGAARLAAGAVPDGDLDIEPTASLVGGARD
jgi:tRNA A37 threonylcarbamoyltransferase TsaD